MKRNRMPGNSQDRNYALGSSEDGAGDCVVVGEVNNTEIPTQNSSHSIPKKVKSVIQYVSSVSSPSTDREPILPALIPSPAACISTPDIAPPVHTFSSARAMENMPSYARTGLHRAGRPGLRNAGRTGVHSVGQRWRGPGMDMPPTFAATERSFFSADPVLMSPPQPSHHVPAYNLASSVPITARATESMPSNVNNDFTGSSYFSTGVEQRFRNFSFDGNTTAATTQNINHVNPNMQQYNTTQFVRSDMGLGGSASTSNPASAGPVPIFPARLPFQYHTMPTIIRSRSLAAARHLENMQSNSNNGLPGLSVYDRGIEERMRNLDGLFLPPPSTMPVHHERGGPGESEEIETQEAHANYRDSSTGDYESVFLEDFCVVIPCLFRDNVRYLALRTIKSVIFDIFFCTMPLEAYRNRYVQSYHMRDYEAHIIGSVNATYNFQFGQEPFTTRDLVVRLEEFFDFHTFLVDAFKRMYEFTDPGQRFGFYHIGGETCVAYVRSNGKTYVPLFYLQDESFDFLIHRAEKIRGWDLEYLKICFKVQNLKPEFFDDSADELLVIDFDIIIQHFPTIQFGEYWPTRNYNHMWINARVISTFTQGYPWIKLPRC